jgi:hypothetical protein
MATEVELAVTVTLGDEVRMCLGEPGSVYDADGSLLLA